MKLGINENISNAAYHADRGFLSSSALKLIYQSPAGYYKKYILGEQEPHKNESAFSFGTALHTKILEPHLFDLEVAIFEGGMRRGKAWEEFKAANAGKTIITAPEYTKLQILFEAHENNEVASKLVANCQYEHTLTADYEGVPLKVRCDAINVDKGYILDVKSTGQPAEVSVFRDVVNGLCYDLSGYMYAKVASIIYGKKFEFFFDVLSKNDNTCQVYRMSKSSFANGKYKFESAIETYKNCLLTGDWSGGKLDSESEIEEV